MPPCDKPKRKVNKFDIEFISLVKKGANRKVITYKSEDGKEQPSINTIIAIKKSDEEQRLVYGIVYSPDQVDSQGDIASAEVIKDAAYSFMQKSQTGNVDKQHTDIPGDGFVAESWIVQKNDPTFPEEPEGSWAVAIKVTKDETWEEVKKGDITGLSLGGYAYVQILDDEASKTPAKKSAIVNVKDFLSRVAKSFITELKNDEEEEKYRKVIWALQDSLWVILNDANITDKKTAIIANCNQFIEYLNNDFTTTINKSQEGEEDMKPEEIQELVKKSVGEAVKPVADELATVKKTLDDTTKENADLKKANEDLTSRLAIVEKAAPGSAQADTTMSSVKKGEEVEMPWIG